MEFLTRHTVQNIFKKQCVNWTFRHLHSLHNSLAFKLRSTLKKTYPKNLKSQIKPEIKYDWLGTNSDRLSSFHPAFARCAISAARKSATCGIWKLHYKCQSHSPSHTDILRDFHHSHFSCSCSHFLSLVLLVYYLFLLFLFLISTSLDFAKEKNELLFWLIVWICLFIIYFHFAQWIQAL